MHACTAPIAPIPICLVVDFDFAFTALQIVLGPDGVPREKPSSPQEAAAFLSSYAGATSRTVSAVVVRNTATGEAAEGVAVETIRYGSGLGAPTVLEACLQPAVPVDSRALRATLRHAQASSSAGASSASSSSSSSAASLGSADANSENAEQAPAGAASIKRRRSARLSVGGVASSFSSSSLSLPPATVSVLTTAGAVMIEHPSIAPHIVSIERGDTTAASSQDANTSSSSSSAPATAVESARYCGGPLDDDDVIDSIYGLPWHLTRALIAKTCKDHPWASTK